MPCSWVARPNHGYRHLVDNLSERTADRERCPREPLLPGEITASRQPPGQSLGGVRRRKGAVSAEWHGWLHCTIDTPLPESGKHPWQKPHVPNATGTQSGYRPQAITIAAVIEPPRMATTRPGHRAVSGAVPRSWQRRSRQELVLA